jgi:soluble lytic murein transglycosylase
MNKIVYIVIILLIFPTVTSADVYKYVDENGVVCYTDAPLNRKAERIIKEKDLSKKRLVTKTRYSRQINDAASKYQIEPALIDAVIKTESNGNSRAVSKKGAMGLMQLMPSTARDMNVSNPFNIEQNIEGGTKYLKYLLERFNGNKTLALAAYNAGPKTVEKYGSVPPYPETKNYVDKVFSLYRGASTYLEGPSVNYRMKKPSRIQKVVLEDGTILFTNSLLSKEARLRF